VKTNRTAVAAVAAAAATDVMVPDARKGDLTGK